MERGFPDSQTVEAAIALAVRAPSVHNSQPWLWRAGDRTVHLYADRSRLLPETDPQGRDLVLSCGAALHHLRAGFAVLGWRAEVHRLPNPADPDHLAAVEVHRRDPSEEDIELAAAIPRRRSDRRRHGSWPVPSVHIGLLAERAAAESVLLRAAEGAAHESLRHAIVTAARRHQRDPAYRLEVAAWSGRHASPDGVPSANVPAPDRTPGALPARPFADPLLPQPADAAADETVLLVLGTTSDDRMSQLRAGEATSAALLTATALGLASCPLTEPLEVADTREILRTEVTGGSCPQMVLRVGWAPINADPLPATPRRDVADVLAPLNRAW